jgi:hypothetical protein
LQLPKFVTLQCKCVLRIAASNTLCVTVHGEFVLSFTMNLEKKCEFFLAGGEFIVLWAWADPDITSEPDILACFLGGITQYRENSKFYHFDLSNLQ